MRRYLVFLSVLALAGWGIVRLTRFLENERRQSGTQGTDSVKTYKSFVYEADPSRWLTFDFSSTRLLRVLSNAILPTNARNGAPATYTLEYQLLDGAGNQIERKSYVHRTSLTFYRPDPTGPPLPLVSSPDPDITVMDGKSFQISFHHVPLMEARLPRRLLLRLQRLDLPLTRVVVRVYCEEEVPPFKRYSRWLRLKRRGRQRIVEGCLYPEELMTVEEKLNGASRIWNVVAPNGVVGEDFRRWFVVAPDQIHLAELEAAEREAGFIPAGLYIPAGSGGAVELPPNGKRYRLEFQPERLVQTAGGAGAIEISHVNDLDEKTVDSSWDCPGRPSTIERDFPGGGMLDIRPPVGGFLRVHWRESGDWRDITPVPSALTAYRLAPGEYVEYRVFPPDKPGERMPLRVDLRGLQPENLPPALPPVVRIRFLGPRGEVRSECRVEVLRDLSRYDRADLPAVRLTDKISRFFLVPAGVKEVRIERIDPGPVSPPSWIVISAFNAPVAAPRRVLVADEIQPFSPAESDVREWFILRASGHQDLLTGERVAGLILQKRPAEAAPPGAPGRVRTESLRPHSGQLQRLLFQERDSSIPTTPLTVGYYFVPLPGGREIRLQFADAERTQVTPRLVHIGPAGTPAVAADLKIDGGFWGRVLLAGPFGETALPRITPGWHSVRIDGPARVRFFVDCTTGGPDLSQLRPVVEADGREIRIVVEKKMARELLVLRLFRTPAAARELKVEARINGPVRPNLEPLTGWTWLHQEFLLGPPGPGRLPIMGLPGALADEGERMFLTLGEDLPAGPVEVVVKLTTAPGCFLSITRSRTGDFEDRQVWIEQEQR